MEKNLWLIEFENNNNTLLFTENWDHFDVRYHWWDYFDKSTCIRIEKDIVLKAFNEKTAIEIDNIVEELAQRISSISNTLDCKYSIIDYLKNIKQ